MIVPTYSQQVGHNSLPGGRFTAPESHNYAIATQAAGAKATMQISDLAAKIQDDLDEAYAKEADVKLNQAYSDILSNPETGYLFTEGKNAYEGYAGVQKAMKDARTKIADGISSGRVKRAFGNVANVRDRDAQQQINRHAGNQIQAFKEKSTIARAELASKTALENLPNWNNPDSKFAFNKELFNREMDEYARMKGMSDEEKELFLLNAKGGLHQMSIHALIKNGDVKGATDYLAHYGKEIDQMRTENLKELIGIASVQENSRQLSRTLVGTKKEKIASLDEMQQKGMIDQPTYDTSKRQVEQQDNERRIQMAQNRQNFFDEVLKIKATNPDATYDSQSADVLLMMRKSGLEEKVKNLFANGRIDDQKIWGNVLSFSDEHWKGMSRAELEEMKCDLSPARRLQAEAKWNQARGSKHNPEHLMGLELGQLINQIAKEAGITPENIPGFMKRANEEILRAGINEVIKSPEDMRERIEKQAVKVAIRNKGYKEVDVRAYQLGSLPKFTPNITEAKRAEIIPLLRSKGLDETEEFIQRFAEEEYVLRKSLNGY